MEGRAHSVSVCQEFCCIYAGKALQMDMWRFLPNILSCRLAASSLMQVPVSKILGLVFALGTDCLKVFLQWAQGLSSFSCFALWCLCDFWGGVTLPAPCWFNSQALSDLRRKGQFYPKV